jgi:hypothetical protein
MVGEKWMPKSDKLYCFRNFKTFLEKKTAHGIKIFQKTKSVSYFGPLAEKKKKFCASNACKK